MTRTTGTHDKLGLVMQVGLRLVQFKVYNWICKLKMPIFEGKDAYAWVYRVKSYFIVNWWPPFV